jgi:hypothetical protein
LPLRLATGIALLLPPGLPAQHHKQHDLAHQYFNHRAAVFYHLRIDHDASMHPQSDGTVCTSGRFHTSRDRCGPAFSLVAPAVVASWLALFAAELVVIGAAAVVR